MEEINEQKKAAYSASTNIQSRMDRLAPARIYGIIALIFFASATAIMERTMVMTPLVRFFVLATLVSTAFTLFIAIASRLRIQPSLIYPMIFLGMLAIVWSVLSNRPPDVVSLRETYTIRLYSHEGEPYLKDGETHAGIDEAGLARSAFWQAIFIEGLREINPRLLGSYFWKYWWRDLSIEDLLDGKYDYTKVVGKTKSLFKYESYDLEKGDMAISTNAQTLLINLGDGKWITASKKFKEVLVIDTHQYLNKKLINTPFTIVRWTITDK